MFYWRSKTSLEECSYLFICKVMQMNMVRRDHRKESPCATAKSNHSLIDLKIEFFPICATKGDLPPHVSDKDQLVNDIPRLSLHICNVLSRLKD